MKITGPIPDHILRLMPHDERPPGVAGMTRTEVDAKQDRQTERDLHNEIESYLATQNIIAGHARMDRKSTYTEGWPDFTFAVNGFPIAVEVKIPGERPTEDQIDVHREMRANGWTVWVVNCLGEVRLIVRDARALTSRLKG